MAWRINVEGVHNLIGLAEQYAARFVHLSIDLVFSGSGGRRARRGRCDRPGDGLRPHDGGRRAIDPRPAPADARLRISLPMGVSFNGHAGAIDWIQSRFKKSKPATLYFDEIRTPTYTDCLNRLCETVLASDLAGLFHAGAKRRLSLYEIAQIINRVGGYNRVS